MRLSEGLVLLSDTRTNAGVDNVGTYRKLFVFHPEPNRLVVIQSAGNLATTQEVIDRLGRDLEQPGENGSLASGAHLFELALYLGRVSVNVASTHRPQLSASGVDGTSTFIIGGQVGDDPPDIMLVYPEGNYIRASDDRPFLQIGETKYGKFLVELATQSGLPMDAAAKVALSSMVSTAHANLSVGPPYDLGLYRTGTFQLEHVRINAESPFLERLQQTWTHHISAALHQLPMVEPGDLELL
jgi:putative proteasome-type protease